MRKKRMNMVKDKATKGRNTTQTPREERGADNEIPRSGTAKMCPMGHFPALPGLRDWAPNQASSFHQTPFFPLIYISPYFSLYN